MILRYIKRQIAIAGIRRMEAYPDEVLEAFEGRPESVKGGKTQRFEV